MTTDLDVHLDAIVDGNRRAFARWCAGAEPAIRDSLRTFAPLIDVESVLQETLLWVWQVAPRHRPDGRANSLLRGAIAIGHRLAGMEVSRCRWS